MPAQGCELNYQVRTKSGEVFGQLTAACPHRGASNSFLRVTWTIRFGLSQGRDSSQQHVRTGGGVQILSYVWIGLSRVRTKSSEVIWLNSDSSQQHAHTGGVRFSPTCKVNYQVRTKSGEVFGQLTAACPHRGGSNSPLRVTWTIRFGLSQGRGSSQQHARTGGRQILSYVWLGLSGSD